MMLVMSKGDVLARVDADLARGFVHPAMQRLASLTATHPDDLDVRTRRAALNRQIGNLVEAGRWGYLTEEVTSVEITAFRCAHRSAWSQLRALKLGNDPTEHLGPLAHRRFTDLVEQAATDGPGSISWSAAGPHLQVAKTWRDSLPCLIAALIALVLIGLLIVGLVTVVRLIIP
jgi:hypothetical protein